MILNSLNSNKVRKTSNVRTKKIRKIFAHCDFKCSNTTFFLRLFLTKGWNSKRDKKVSFSDVKMSRDSPIFCMQKMYLKCELMSE